MADEHLPEDYFVAGDDGDDLVADGADQRTASAEKKVALGAPWHLFGPASYPNFCLHP